MAALQFSIAAGRASAIHAPGATACNWNRASGAAGACARACAARRKAPSSMDRREKDMEEL